MSIEPTYVVAPHFKLITAVTYSFPNILKLSMPKYIVWRNEPRAADLNRDAVAENTLGSKGKYHCTADLQFD